MVESKSERGGSDDFQGIAGQEWHYGEREGGPERGVGEHSQPKRARGEDDEVARGGAECGSGESTMDAAIEERNQEGAEGVGEQVTTCGSKEMRKAAGVERGGRKDGQAQRALNQVSGKCSRSQTRSEQQTQDEDGKGRKGERHGRKV